MSRWDERWFLIVYHLFRDAVHGPYPSWNTATKEAAILRETDSAITHIELAEVRWYWIPHEQWQPVPDVRSVANSS